MARLLILMAWVAWWAQPAFCQECMRPNPGDVIAFLGGSDVAAQSESGHLEALLALKFQPVNVRFRNFGWEGDTVFNQPRDLNFPSIREWLERAHATMVVLEFGRAESLSATIDVARFAAAYEKFIETSVPASVQLTLVTPPLFEKPRGMGPNLTTRNQNLAACAEAIRGLARKRRACLIDLQSEVQKQSGARLTEDGVQFTPRGQAVLAQLFLKQLGTGPASGISGKIRADGSCGNEAFETLRQAILKKNRLWFNYWRPQNWAFLGGDRVSQPSSHDHRDPNIRWFPAEMKKYEPLIEQAEVEIKQAAAQVTK